EEGASGRSAAAHGLNGLAARPRRIVERQSERQDVPIVPLGGEGGVQLGAEQGREIPAAQAACVGDRIAIDLPEVVSQGEKVITRPLVEIGDRVRRELAIRPGRMGVQIAAPEPAGAREWWCLHVRLLARTW